MSKICRPGLLALCWLPVWTAAAFAHGVATGDQSFLNGVTGIRIGPYLYLGAKHMITGHDHLLYLAGVIFFLGRLSDVLTFVSLFAVGHSITLLFGVLSGLSVNAFAVDAIIGLSVSYKALENLGTIRLVDPRLAVFGFGLIHGLGLSSKLQDLSLSSDGLIVNMLAFNVGVEVGQTIALGVLFVVLNALRRRPDFLQFATGGNVALFAAGLVLFATQSVGFFIT